MVEQKQAPRLAGARQVGAVGVSEVPQSANGIVMNPLVTNLLPVAIVRVMVGLGCHWLGSCYKQSSPVRTGDSAIGEFDDRASGERSSYRRGAAVPHSPEEVPGYRLDPIAAASVVHGSGARGYPIAMPSPAACGKRKHDELAAAKMLVRPPLQVTSMQASCYQL